MKARVIETGEIIDVDSYNKALELVERYSLNLIDEIEMTDRR